MKLKITEIEASAEELRQSNSLAEGLRRVLLRALDPYEYIETEEDADHPEGDNDQ